MFLNYCLTLGLIETPYRLAGSKVCCDVDDFIDSALRDQTVSISTSDLDVPTIIADYEKRRFYEY